MVICTYYIGLAWYTHIASIEIWHFNIMVLICNYLLLSITRHSFFQLYHYTLNLLFVQALEISPESHEVDCEDLNQVANFSLHQYLRLLSLEGEISHPLMAAEAYSVHKLLPGIFPRGTTADPDLRGQWVRALIPVSLQPHICHPGTFIGCDCQ